MAKKKLYAVKRGRSIGIFETWDACKNAVDGYPGAEYKSFLTIDEANKYLSDGKIEMESATLENGEECSFNQVIAYVDGSFDEKLGVYSFGCIIITPNGEIIKESGNGNNPESLALRNVTGEMLGAMYAVKWCDTNGYPSLQICYDYTGLEMWATGAWKAKNTLTGKYTEFMKENQKKINISFKKISAHTGDKYNEEADKLAKAALISGNGIPKIKRDKRI